MSRLTPAEFLEAIIDDDLPLAPPERFVAPLHALRQVLDAPEDTRDFSRVPGLSRFAPPARLSGAMLAEATASLLAVVESRGAGKAQIETGLLQLLAVSAAPGSLPLFERLLTYTRPRDSFSTARRTWCLAAIALLAQMHRDRDAAQRIEAILRESADPRLRLAAIDAVAHLWHTATGELTADAVTLLTAVARHDRDAAPRAAARRWLAGA